MTEGVELLGAPLQPVQNGNVVPLFHLAVLCKRSEHEMVI